MAESTSVHVPVLLEEVVQWLAPRQQGILVDGTLGAATAGPWRGKWAMTAWSSPWTATRPPWPCSLALAQLPVKPVHANFCDLPEVLGTLGIQQVDGIVLDLGLSGDQLADPERGFSFSSSGPLDLRFDPLRGEPARRLINRLSAEHLADLIYHYGEERYSRRVAQAIVQQRREKPIETAAELAELVRRCVPRSRVERIDPATRTFQALRIAVNDELKSLEVALRRLPDCLRPGARLAVISFHSLEDRRVKEAFRDDPRLQVLTRKPVCAGAAEVDRNPGEAEQAEAPRLPTGGVGNLICATRSPSPSERGDFRKLVLNRSPEDRYHVPHQSVCASATVGPTARRPLDGQGNEDRISGNRDIICHLRGRCFSAAYSTGGRDGCRDGRRREALGGGQGRCAGRRLEVDEFHGNGRRADGALRHEVIRHRGPPCAGRRDFAMDHGQRHGEEEFPRGGKRGVRRTAFHDSRSTDAGGRRRLFRILRYATDPAAVGCRDAGRPVRRRGLGARQTGR